MDTTVGDMIKEAIINLDLTGMVFIEMVQYMMMKDTTKMVMTKMVLIRTVLTSMA